MLDLFKTGIVLISIVVLLRKKISMSVVMPLGALLIAALYLTPPLDVASAVFMAIFSPKSLDMTLTLMLTMVMEHILRTTGMLTLMVTSLSRAVPDRRFVMAAMPAMIGMLPSPGGAVFSAPMVEEAAGMELHLSPEQKSLINYWYRHIWEYISPLYPGIILVSGLTGLSTQTIFLAQLPFAISVVVWGIVFCFRHVPATSYKIQPDINSRTTNLFSFFATISPILLALLLTVVFRVNPALSLGGSVLTLYLYHRYTPLKIIENLKASISAKALFLVIGIMIFQEVLKTTGALVGISQFAVESHLQPHLVLIVIPFIAGVMTGLTVGFVGITFPLLLPFMGVNVSPSLVALAFASGFAGVMLSPVHLCYVLTCEYFKADIARVYHKLFIPSALVLLAALIPLLLY